MAKQFVGSPLKVEEDRGHASPQDDAEGEDSPYGPEDGSQQQSRQPYNSLQALHQAIKDGQIELADLQRDLEDNDRETRLLQTCRGKIALHIACKYNKNAEIVRELLKDKDTRDKQLEAKEPKYGNTPLHIAAYHGNDKIVEELLKYNSDYSPKEDEGTTSGDSTSQHIGIELQTLDSSTTCTLMKLRNNLNDTPMHTAAYTGHVRVFELMNDIDEECITLDGCYKGLPLHIACGYGHLEVVKKLYEWYPDALDAASLPVIKNPSQSFKQLKDSKEDSKEDSMLVETFEWKLEGNAEKQDEYTPLTRACQFNRLKVVRYLLEKGAKRYSLALIKAIEGSYKECVKELLFTVEKTKAGETMEILRTNCKSEHGLLNPFCELIRHMPDVAEAVLHKNCVEIKTSLLIPATFKFSYELFDHRQAKDEQSIGADKRCCSNGFNKINHPLAVMVQYKRLNLLTHPVVASLIHDKWKSVYGIVSLLHWISYLGFLAITNSLLLTLPHPSLCPVQVNGSGAGLCGDSSVTEDYFNDQLIGSSTRKMNIGLASIMLLYSVIRLVFELIQAVSSIYLACCSAPLLIHQHYESEKCLLIKIFRVIKGMNYFWDIVNWVEVTLFSLSTIVAVMVMKEGPCLTGWAWQIGAVVMWLSWIQLIYISMQFQFIGVYALMFNRILKTLLKLIPLALILIIAFGLTFHLLLYQPQLKASPYHTQGYSLLKALSMTTGDTDTDTFFGFSYICGQTQDTTHLEYLGLSTFFWIISLILMTIILSNLLIGLAVGDIQSIYEKASFEKLALQVGYILTIESQIRSFPCKWCKGSGNGKEFTPSKPSKWYQQIWDEFVYFMWGGTRYDSWENKQRLIDYRNSHTAEHRANDASLHPD